MRDSPSLSIFEHQRFPVERIGDALEAIERRSGRFTNVVITHE